MRPAPRHLQSAASSEPSPAVETYPPGFGLAPRLRVLFPSANIGEEIEVVVAADGSEQITNWRLDAPQPSRKEIESVVIPEPNLALTARQARLWLLSVGLNDNAVRGQIARIPDEKQRAAALIEWEYSVEIHIDHPLVQSIAAALGFGPTLLRAAFETARNL